MSKQSIIYLNKFWQSYFIRIQIWAHKFDLFAPCVRGIKERRHEAEKVPVFSYNFAPYEVDFSESA